MPGPKVFREDRDSGHLVPVEQVARPQASLAELGKALQSFVAQAHVEDRCLLTPRQADLLLEQIGAPRAVELDALRTERDALLAEVEQLRTWKAARDRQDAADAAHQPPQGVTVTVAAAGQIATYSLANGHSRIPGGDGIAEPAHSIGAALLQVAAREWAGMARPAAQAGPGAP